MKNNLIVRAICEILGFAAVYFAAWFYYAYRSGQPFAEVALKPVNILVPVVYAVIVIIQTYYRSNNRRK